MSRLGRVVLIGALASALVMSLGSAAFAHTRGRDARAVRLHTAMARHVAQAEAFQLRQAAKERAVMLRHTVRERGLTAAQAQRLARELRHRVKLHAEALRIRAEDHVANLRRHARHLR